MDVTLGQPRRTWSPAEKRAIVAETFAVGARAASMYTLLQTARLNDVDPQAWLADVLARIAETPMSRLADLLPWNWQAPSIEKAA
jgi:hypothetical protein